MVKSMIPVLKKNAQNLIVFQTIRIEEGEASSWDLFEAGENPSFHPFSPWHKSLS